MNPSFWPKLFTDTLARAEYFALASKLTQLYCDLKENPWGNSEALWRSTLEKRSLTNAFNGTEGIMWKTGTSKTELKSYLGKLLLHEEVLFHYIFFLM